MRGFALLLAFVAPALLGTGCASTTATLSAGKEYPIGALVTLKPGVSEKEVLKLLGTPYATGTDSSGNSVLRYEHFVTRQEVFGFGVGAMKVTAQQNVTGGRADIIIDPRTGLVTSVRYEIKGAKWYDELRGERRDAKRE